MSRKKEGEGTRQGVVLKTRVLFSFLLSAVVAAARAEPVCRHLRPEKLGRKAVALRGECPPPATGALHGRRTRAVIRLIAAALRARVAQLARAAVVVVVRRRVAAVARRHVVAR